MKYKCVKFSDLWEKYDGLAEEQLETYLNENQMSKDQIVSVSYAVYKCGYTPIREILLVYMED